MRRAVGALERPGAWFWAALVLGAGVRGWLVWCTEGTFDVSITHLHGHSVNAFGVLEYYQRSTLFNHPPAMGRVFAGMEAFAAANGIPFRVLLRAPFAALDLGTAALALRLLRPWRWRFAACAAYWLHPLAFLFSAYHGNTDSAVAFFALLGTAAAASGRAAAAGAALGLGLWVKLPALIAAPALCFGLAGWTARARFAAALAAVGAAGALPELLQAPALLFQRIVAYPGTGVETPRGIAVWGIWHVLGLAGTPAARFATANNTFLCWIPIFALAWLRRRQRDGRGLGASVCASCILLYGFTSFFAFQYLAWSAPFWLFLDPRLSAPVTLLLGSYVYGVYALFTGSALLRGPWDFVGHAPWPWGLSLLRNASVLACFLLALCFLTRAVLAARRRGGRGET